MMALAHNRVAVMHGVNLDMLGSRDPEQYGSATLSELEAQIRRWAKELELEPSFFQTNHEGEFIERLHRLPEVADAVILNPGAWTHYSYAIRDALEIAALPAVEVHLSDVGSREEWRRTRSSTAWSPASSPARGLTATREALDLLARGARVDERRRARRAGSPRSSPSASSSGLLVGGLLRPGDSSPMEMLNLRWLTGFTGTSGSAVVGARAAAVRDRLPLRASGPQRDLGDVFELVVAERHAARARLAARGQDRLRRVGDHRASLRAARGGAGGRRRAGQRARARREAAAEQGRRRAWMRSPRQPQLADEVFRRGRRAGLGGPDRARRRSLRPRPGCASSAPSRPSRRSWRRRRTGRSRIRSRPSARSAQASSSSSTWARCSTATARTARARMRRRESMRRPREVYELVREAQAAALEGGRPRRVRAPTSMRSRAT